MLNDQSAFDETRAYMEKLGSLVNEGQPSPLDDESITGALGSIHTDVEVAFCKLQATNIAQACEQLRVAIGRDELDHVGVVGVNIALIIDRIEELAGSASADGAAPVPRALTFEDAEREYCRLRAKCNYLDQISNDSDENSRLYDQAVEEEDAARLRLLSIRPRTAEEAMRLLYIKAETEPDLSAYALLRDIEDASRLVRGLEPVFHTGAGN